MTPTQIYQKRYREAHREQRKKAMLEWNRTHREWRREYERKYWAAHSAARRRKVRAAYLKNRLPRIAQTKAYAAAHRDHLKEKSRLYDARPDRIAKRAACTKRWIKAHPEATKARNAKRKAAIRGASGGTREANAMIRRWKRLKNFVCYYCHEKFPARRLHIDHILAISNGGKHTEDNLCAACDKCNLKKRAFPVSELTFIPQRLLSL